MSKNTGAQQTHITVGTSIHGEIKVENDLRIDGYVKGAIQVGGMLIIGETGKIEGDVVSHSVTVAGQIQGNLHGLEKVVLESKAVLVGDLQTRELVIHERAYFNGNCSMSSNEK